jgi:hypothetical protein
VRIGSRGRHGCEACWLIAGRVAENRYLDFGEKWPGRALRRDLDANRLWSSVALAWAHNEKNPLADPAGEIHLSLLKNISLGKRFTIEERS